MLKSYYCGGAGLCGMMSYKFIYFLNELCLLELLNLPIFLCFLLRDVFECSVLICFWRIRHAWHKNLVKKCLATDMQVEISRRLGQAVDNICRGLGTVGLFEDLLEDFVDESEFMDYFKAIWYPRIGLSSFFKCRNVLASCIREARKCIFPSSSDIRPNY